MAEGAAFEAVTVVDHPLVVHKLNELRDPATQAERFRNLVRDISTVLAVEATRDLPVKPQPVETGLGVAAGAVVAVPLVVVPILRAGLGMAAAVNKPQVRASADACSSSGVSSVGARLCQNRVV